MKERQSSKCIKQPGSPALPAQSRKSGDIGRILSMPDFTISFAQTHRTIRMKYSLVRVTRKGDRLNTIQLTRCFALKSLLALLTPIMLFTPHAYAETYVAGQMGVTLPSIGSGLSNTDLTRVFIQGSALSDQALTSSILLWSKSRALLHRCTLGRLGSRGL